ncbi:partner of Y14 and mago [Drosophila sulfurigaster albostrigata]|uniref:partner of Y14 and mago n=1 Tax=Drosophila sulfurigaster albostrigata TaxID=89887 RepID=UPI002D21B5D5|nr:partner of Y14 and mago [Drosophila sulfurigaster albostrigata]
MSTYLESDKGKFIPATKRPDGTWRKARRVKDGYVPQEEVPLYESKGKQFVAQRQTGVPPGMCPLVAAELKKAHEKKEKAKQQRVDRSTTTTTKAAQVTTPASATATTIKPAQFTASAPKAKNDREIAALANTLDAELKLNAESHEVDTAKQLKKLRKKIREIEQIESKMQAGNPNKLDKDQLDKVKKKSEILKQLSQLEELAKV